MQFLYQNCSDSDFQSDYSDEWMRGVQGSFSNAAISCDNVIHSKPVYGVPVMEFRISRKAEDAKTGQPVKGIAVT